MGRRSRIKMFSEKAEDDRQIEEFQTAYNSTYTPYHNSKFSDTTYKICENNIRTFNASLKICKVIILGDVAVGKTCIVNRFCHKLFESNYKATIGVDFEVERFDVLNVPFTMQIWDTAGQERFKSIAQSYYRGAQVIIIVFDLSSVFSLANCKKWLQEALNASGDGAPFLFLVGTKMDLLSRASFESVEKNAVKVANKLNAEFWAVSSKNGANIKELFFRVASLSFEDVILKGTEECRKIIGSDLVSFKKNSKKVPVRSCDGSKCVHK